MDILDAVVIGAGQAGLSAAFHLGRLGLSHVVLDADEAPGGAWQHRWDSLTMHDVHGIAALPGSTSPGESAASANTVLPAYFSAYERAHAIAAVRPVAVDRVTDDGGLLETHAGDRSWTSRTIINATGTWSHPFVPFYPGIDSFAGEQLHPVDYPGPEHFRGRRTLVVGGGASAVQLLGEIAPVTDTVWVTRRPPVWRTDDFTPEAGRRAVALVEERVPRGGIQLDGTTAVVDRRVQLVGYGPSASTIGANRAGRTAARGVVAWLDGHADAEPVRDAG